VCAAATSGVLALPVVTGFITTTAYRSSVPRAMVCLRSTLGGFSFDMRYREGVLPRRPHQADRGAANIIGWRDNTTVDRLGLPSRRCSTRSSDAQVVGRRDYAMLLLMVTYGLRACEVAALTLDDLDWKRDRLHVRERRPIIPLPIRWRLSIGLMAHHRLPEEWPAQCGEPSAIFWRHLAPRSPLTHAAVSSVCQLTYLAEGWHPGVAARMPTRCGHACVQRLVDVRCFPLKTVGDYVGHRSPSSTMIYCKGPSRRASA